MAAAAGPVVVAGDEEKNPQSISLIHKAYVVVPTTLEGRSDEKSEEKSNSERKINNENWRVYFQPEEVIAYITANKDTTSLIMHVKMEMVGEQFENRDSIIYLTTYEFIEKFNHEIKIGYYGTHYPGWRRMTMAEWMNPTWQKWIVSSHIENHGWDIIGQSLMPVKNSLHVEEGLVLINDNVIMPKHDSSIISEQQTIDKYSAANGKGVSWNTTPPAQDSTWSFTPETGITTDASCIFVKINNVVQQNPALTLVSPAVTALTAPSALTLTDPTVPAPISFTAPPNASTSTVALGNSTSISTIRDTIIREIKRIDGPIYGALLIPNQKLIDMFTTSEFKEEEKKAGLSVPRQPPIFLMLGDYHVNVDDTKRCNPCTNKDGCYSVYTSKINGTNHSTFLDYLQDKGDTWNIDLFLEDWTNRTRGTSKSNTLTEGSLGNLREILSACTTSQKTDTCIYDKFRTHDSDVRLMNSNNKYPMDAFRWNIKALVFTSNSAPTAAAPTAAAATTVPTMAEILTEITEKKIYWQNKLNRLKLNVDDVLKELQQICSPNTSINMLFTSNIYRHSRALHELNKLPLVLKTMIIEQIKRVYGEYTLNPDDSIDTIIISNNNKIQELFALLINPSDTTIARFENFKVFKEIIDSTFSGASTFNMLLMDIYTLARALKLPKNQPRTSQLAIIYQGKHHIENQIKLLEKYYTVHYEWISQNGDDSKCTIGKYPIRVAVGIYDKTYPGWRRVIATEWTDPVFQAQLVAAHQEGGGWPLLEEPLLCKTALNVEGGWARIDGERIVEVGYTDGTQQLRGVYSAMNYVTKVAWTTTAPTLGNNWTFKTRIELDYPCLFVQDGNVPDAAAAAGPEAVTASNALDIMVGYRNKHYNGYRMVTIKDIERPEWRKKLIEAHRIHDGGWPLLEQSLKCDVTLRVQEGALKLNNISVCDLKCTPTISINSKYEPCPVTIKDNKYTTEELKKITDWTVSILPTNEGKAYPCLFVKE